MLGWYFEVATAQSKNEVAHVAEATEFEKVASKVLAAVSGRLHETNANTTTRVLNSENFPRSLPLIARQNVTRVSSKKIFSVTCRGYDNELRKMSGINQ